MAERRICNAMVVGSIPVLASMERSDAYGVSRTRDRKGVIVKRDVRDWVNCVHTMCGGGWETMEVLVLEVYESDKLRSEG